MQKTRKRIKLSDIGYYGRRIDTLSKAELQNAIVEVVQLLYRHILTDEISKESNIERQEGYVEIKMIEKGGGKDRRITGDRRLGTNPKGYNGPEKRSVFDRRSYFERRQAKFN